MNTMIAPQAERVGRFVTDAFRLPPSFRAHLVIGLPISPAHRVDEDKLLRFELERSLDGIAWSSVAGAGWQGHGNAVRHVKNAMDLQGPTLYHPSHEDIRIIDTATGLNEKIGELAWFDGYWLRVVVTSDMPVRYSVARGER